jgi:starvation-inducible DNA-binding protein
MVQEIIRDYEHILEDMFRAIEFALAHGDSGTEDMIKGFVQKVKKNHWMFTAFSQIN